MNVTPVASPVIPRVPARRTAAAAVRLILDTDMGNDIDDALALALIHALERRGACRLLGITLTNSDPLAAPYVEAFNRLYGRTDIAVGISPEAPFVDNSRFLHAAFPAVGSSALNGRIPPSLHPRSVSLLRQLLAAAPDASVEIVQIGFFTNLAQLLESAPDEHSPLFGRELVEAKVSLLSAMAGNFQVNPPEVMREFNIRHDVASAQKVAEAWPTPIVWSGWEVGDAIRFPAEAIEQGFAHSAAPHLLPVSYQLYEPTPHERPTWDLTSALYAIYPQRHYFGLSPFGRVVIDASGVTRFERTPDGRDRFLTVNREQSLVLRTLFGALCTEPFLRQEA